jgi:hypothetical protein
VFALGGDPIRLALVASQPAKRQPHWRDLGYVAGIHVVAPHIEGHGIHEPIEMLGYRPLAPAYFYCPHCIKGPQSPAAGFRGHQSLLDSPCSPIPPDGPRGHK